MGHMRVGRLGWSATVQEVAAARLITSFRTVRHRGKAKRAPGWGARFERPRRRLANGIEEEDYMTV
jgi:hypothetical protein